MAKVSRFTQDNQNPVGMIVHSMLTEAQFQAINGTNWVLADGRSVAGSTYATVTGSSTVPDARGMVLRAKNNNRADGNQNPDGDSALGTYQADAFASHTHTYRSNEQTPGSYSNSGTGADASKKDSYDRLTVAQGGNETRMKNITVNIFIKIN